MKSAAERQTKLKTLVVACLERGAVSVSLERENTETAEEFDIRHCLGDSTWNVSIKGKKYFLAAEFAPYLSRIISAGLQL